MKKILLALAVILSLAGVFASVGKDKSFEEVCAAPGMAVGRCTETVAGELDSLVVRAMDNLDGIENSVAYFGKKMGEFAMSVGQQILRHIE